MVADTLNFVLSKTHGQSQLDTTGPALVIADIWQLQQRGRILPVINDVYFVELAQLKVTLIQRIMPEIVLSPLIAFGFDASEVVKRLSRFEFRGAYRILTDPLPDRNMVLRELRRDAPDIDIDLFELGGL